MSDDQLIHILISLKNSSDGVVMNAKDVLPGMNESLSSNSRVDLRVNFSSKKSLTDDMYFDDQTERKVPGFEMHIKKTLQYWFDNNRDKPYPTDSEKYDLCIATGLTLTQINNWMSNARRRQLKNRAYIRPLKYARHTQPAPKLKKQAGKQTKTAKQTWGRKSRLMPK